MDWSKVFEAVITLIIVLIMCVVLPYIKTRIGAENFAELQKWIKVAVQAAELIYTESGMGEVKKKYVEAFIQDMHLDVTAEQLDTLIESAVLELKKGLE